MAEATFTFPSEFLWGTATSSHQVEGQNFYNDWYVWEQDGNILNHHTSKVACDWWSGRWKEDFDRVVDTGQNSHRFSIEWSRIQPAPNRFDDSALEFYREMARSLRQRCIEPVVTLHHFTNPIWLQEIQGWESDLVVDYFRDFVYRVVKALKEYVNFWVTINEPNVYAISGYFLKDFPPGKRSLRSVYQVFFNMLRAHSAAYKEIHDLQPDAKVGVANHYRGFSPLKGRSLINRWIAKNASQLFNNTFPNTLHTGIFRFLGKSTRISQAKGTQDFFGLNYYTQELISLNPIAIREGFIRRNLNPKVEHSSTSSIANEPDIFYQALIWANQFGMPIYITENGIDDEEDLIRPQYLIQHLHQVWRGINFNWPIRGYFHWTLVDNFEWERGWTQRFGLWALDPKSQNRSKRRSADLYEAICNENAIHSAMVLEHAPTLKEKLFPG